MLSRDLLRDAVEACAHARAPISPSFLQRRIRVGWATASQLLDALQAAAVVGPRPDRVQANMGRPVLVRDPAVGHPMVDAAIADGRIGLTVLGDARAQARQHPFDAARTATGPIDACGYVFHAGDVSGFCARTAADPIHGSPPDEVEIHESHQPEPVGTRLYPGGQACQRCCKFVAFEGAAYRITIAGANPCMPGNVGLRR